MGWIDVPSHRILVVDVEQLKNDFDYLAEDGTAVQQGQRPYAIIRRNDGKQFKPARFWPTDCLTKNQWELYT